MDTLEKIELARSLKLQAHELELVIREEQSKCEHIYPDNPLFDSQYFYGRCTKCGYEKQIEHTYPHVLDNDKFERSELQKLWDKIILNSLY